MALSDAEKAEYANRLVAARTRMLCLNGFFGLLLMHAGFALDEKIETAATDGSKIYFCPEFMDDLSDSELDFVLLHEIMHIVLDHCRRGINYNPELFNIACDVVVNSNILYSYGGEKRKITLKKYGESMHLAPDNKEGYNYTAEQVYEMLMKQISKQKGGKSASGNNPGENENGSGQDSDSNRSNGKGKGGKGGKSKGGSDGKNENGDGNGNGDGKNGSGKRGSVSVEGDWDEHGKWGKMSEEQSDDWNAHVLSACEAIAGQKGIGALPLLAQRLYGELTKPKIDWRSILNDFVQEEICDYSFSPPDRRFSDFDVILPDFNDTDATVKNVYFFMDTSGSIDDKMLTAAYSEIVGAIEAFNGKLCGYLGFFDASVIPPVPFESVDEVKKIEAYGGGGTSFHAVFDYLLKKVPPEDISSVIILTDGYAEFPETNPLSDVPVLWAINNDKITPPWGRVCRMIEG